MFSFHSWFSSRKTDRFVNGSATPLGGVVTLTDNPPEIAELIADATEQLVEVWDHVEHTKAALAAEQSGLFNRVSEIEADKAAVWAELAAVRDGQTAEGMAAEQAREATLQIQEAFRRELDEQKGLLADVIRNLDALRQYQYGLEHSAECLGEAVGALTTRVEQAELKETATARRVKDVRTRTDAFKDGLADVQLKQTFFQVRLEAVEERLEDGTAGVPAVLDPDPGSLNGSAALEVPAGDDYEKYFRDYGEPIA